jgi:micrococcal nuclease
LRARGPLALLLVAAALTGGGCASERSGGNAASGVPAAPEPGSSATGRVERVVDGDTIDVEQDGRRVRVRLTGVDTPETVKPGSPVECFGPESSARTTALLDGERVRLEYDVETTDRYERRLAYVFRAADGVFVNEALLRGGYAERFRSTPNRRYVDRLIEAETAARRENAGLWGACRR